MQIYLQQNRIYPFHYYIYKADISEAEFTSVPLTAKQDAREILFFLDLEILRKLYAFNTLSLRFSHSYSDPRTGIDNVEEETYYAYEFLVNNSKNLCYGFNLSKESLSRLDITNQFSTLYEIKNYNVFLSSAINYESLCNEYPLIFNSLKDILIMHM
jgi:hypothetical protein